MTDELTDMTNQPRRRLFISLQIKLLAIFTLLFVAIFAGTFLWFYSFASARAVERLSEDLNIIVDAAHDYVDGDDLQTLLAEGERSEDGNSDHPVYVDYADYFTHLKEIDPRGSANILVLRDNEYFVVVAAEAFTDPDNTADYLESIGLTVDDIVDFGWADFNGLFTNTIERWTLVEPYEDPFGAWISGYRAIHDSEGNDVGVIGVDFRADYYFSVQRQIRKIAAQALGLTFLIVFITVFAASTLMARPLRTLAGMATSVGEGDYEQDFHALSGGALQDEISGLASVFEIMVEKVHAREEKLKQQVAELRIVIDEQKKQEQVQEIVSSDAFRELQEKAATLRRRRTERSGRSD